MKNNKVKIAALKVKSFVTVSDDQKKKIQGGLKPSKTGTCAR